MRPATARGLLDENERGRPRPAGDAPPCGCDFLERITDGDRQTCRPTSSATPAIALTGSIEEHVFGFGWGKGANGKSVDVNTIAGIMGDYAVTIPTEMLMVSSRERHPTELARLRGVRLAIGPETEEGKRWAEARVKALTGGDPVPARFMRQDFFEFPPQFKLFVVGNTGPRSWSR